jgi:type II secretory pathway predicted ATPase ExeA
MYTEFYNFSEMPFNLTPDPKFLYLTPSHREALAAMLYGIKERKGIISVTGEVGTGKTTLIHSLLKKCNEGIKTVFIFYTNITFENLLKNILFELELPIIEEEKTALLHQLNNYLIQRLSCDENVVVIIDEAQNLFSKVMEELRMLSNLETPKSKLLQLVLVGQPELEVKLDSGNLRQLKQRIGIRRQISALSREECIKYIDHRLNLVGSSTSRIFTSEAIALICDYAKGIPRTINILCDNALLIGYGLSQKKINGDIIHEVIRDMDSSIFEKYGHPEHVTVNLSQPYIEPLTLEHKPRIKYNKERRFHIKKKLIFPISISIMTIFLILSLFIFKRHEVAIQPKEMSKAVVQESPKIVPKETGKVEETKPIIVEPPVTSRSRTEVEPKSDVKPSAQAILKPEISLKVEKGGPKEISKVIVRESPKVVTKEIKKVEEPNATVREPLPPPETETSVKVKKPAPTEFSIVPPESPKIMPKEIAKIEEPKATVREPLPTPKPETPVKHEEVVPKEISKIIPPPSPIAKEEEVRQFFADYIDRYTRKDIDGFLSFFSSKAVQNQKDGFAEIRKNYTNFFNQSQELRYHMRDMKIEIYQNSLEVKARYELDQILRKGGEKKVWRGNIRWVLGKEDGVPKILSLDYQQE